MNPKNNIHNSWFPIVGFLYEEPLKTLSEQILPNISYQPASKDIFNVFTMPVSDIKVVIIGQDPYPTPGNAIGYAFLVNEGVKTPKSLQIITKEILTSDYEHVFSVTDNGQKHISVNPNSWVSQGVFLLNTALTVETGKAGSHLHYWEKFTKQVITYISASHPTIWLLWGKKAQSYLPYIQHQFRVTGYDNDTIDTIPINSDWNYILTAPHPAAEIYSPGAGFYGCNHFNYTNILLHKLKKSRIIW